MSNIKELKKKKCKNMRHKNKSLHYTARLTAYFSHEEIN